MKKEDAITLEVACRDRSVVLLAALDTRIRKTQETTSNPLWPQYFGFLRHFQVTASATNVLKGT